MNLRHLTYLVALARERHFHRAAKASHITQPTLSAAIRQLEAELGVPLVLRSRQRFEGFTAEGQQVLAWAQRILADCAALKQALGESRDALRGHLRIGVIPTVEPVIARLTSTMRTRYPGVMVAALSKTSREIERGLAEHALDVGISYIEEPLSGGLRAIPLFPERYVLVGKSHLLTRHRKAISWREAASLPLCLLDAAVRASSSGIFFNAGQVCSAGSRILVQQGAYREFVERLTRRAEAIRVGDPLDPTTTMGPLISRKQQERVLDYIATGQREGARLSYGGEAPAHQGYFVQPTVFADVRNDMRIAREEIFGPVAVVIPFRDEQEAIALANDSPFSLAAAVWTRDIGRAHNLAHRLRAGTVWVNTYGHTDTRLPWGGYGGDSGIGRDLGSAALDNYTEQKTIWVQLGGRGPSV